MDTSGSRGVCENAQERKIAVKKMSSDYSSSCNQNQHILAIGDQKNLGTRLLLDVPFMNSTHHREESQILQTCNDITNDGLEGTDEDPFQKVEQLGGDSTFDGKDGPATENQDENIAEDSVSFYFGSRFGFGKIERKRLFQMINELPTIFEVVTGFVKQAKDQADAPNNSSKNKSSGRMPSRQPDSQPKGVERSAPKDEDELCCQVGISWHSPNESHLRGDVGIHPS